MLQQMNAEDITLIHEISQTQKTKYYMMPLTEHFLQ